MDPYGHADCTFLRRTSFRRSPANDAGLRARHICRADKEWENKPVGRLLRPTEIPALWHNGLVHRVDLSSDRKLVGKVYRKSSALADLDRKPLHLYWSRSR